jgi:hypothetical protein
MRRSRPLGGLGGAKRQVARVIVELIIDKVQLAGLKYAIGWGAVLGALCEVRILTRGLRATGFQAGQTCLAGKGHYNGIASV